MTSGRIWVVRVFDAPRPARQYHLEADVFNMLVEEGFDYITFLGPTFRLTSSVEDWLDYGMYDMVDDCDVIVMRTSRMEKA
jgi:hypothetical protein